MKIRLKFDREFHLIDPIFFKKKFRYIFQSFIASIALMVVLIVGDNIAQGAIIAGIAGTTALISFIVVGSSKKASKLSCEFFFFPAHIFMLL